MSKGVPTGYHSLTPSVIVKDARKAIDFFKRAFGAEEIDTMTGPDGRIMHAEIRIGDSMLMMGEENPAWSQFKSAETMGGSPFSLHIYVPDVDAAFKRATDAGAKVEMPVQDMFWGDRYGKVRDPFGHVWGLATRVKELTKEEVERAGREWMATMAAAKPQ
jgi:uncharacterized glyoxalase superfamily protein PhnB